MLNPLQSVILFSTIHRLEIPFGRSWRETVFDSHLFFMTYQLTACLNLLFNAEYVVSALKGLSFKTITKDGVL